MQEVRYKLKSMFFTDRFVLQYVRFTNITKVNTLR